MIHLHNVILVQVGNPSQPDTFPNALLWQQKILCEVIEFLLLKTTANI